MANDSEDTRELGIEFGGLTDDLEEESYPLSKETLLDRYGDRELGLGDDQVTLSEVLFPENEQDFEDPDSVQQAILNMVGDEAVGREGYTDRGGHTEKNDEDPDNESF